MSRWPNFFLAGAPKAGTTALYGFLAQHPQVYLSPIKEPSFFAQADLARPPWRDPIRRGVERDRDALARYLEGPMTERYGNRPVLEERQYLALFRPAGDRPVVGEGSVTYFWQPGAAAAIASRIPHARLAFVLRDPAERMFSQYLASAYTRPGSSFRRQFQAALDSDEEWAGWIDAGRYATNLKRFFAVFPREQIRVYLYDEYRNQAGAVLRDLFGFLGIDPQQPIDTTRRANEPAIPRFAALHGLRVRLFGRRKLMDSVPVFLRPLARRAYLRGRDRVRLARGDRQLVIDQLGDEIRETAGLIGRDLSAWLR